jgi:hypothetical protein
MLLGKLPQVRINFLLTSLNPNIIQIQAFGAANNTTKSAFWSSVMSVRDVLIKNCTVQIHKGDSSICSTPWCEIWNEIHNHLKLPATVDKLPNSISELWNPQSFTWNNKLISQVFDTLAINSINKIVPVPSNKPDNITWTPSKKGECSTKDAFRYLNNQLQVQLPTQGARSVSAEALYILKRVWKCRLISPVVKTFLWRPVRRALATAQRAGNLSPKIDKNCSLCGMTENDSHLFFHCEFSRAVWFSTRIPLLSSLLPHEQDGVQVALAGLITPKPLMPL